jgi:hypothetical protein
MEVLPGSPEANLFLADRSHGEHLEQLFTMAENVPPVEDARRFAFSCFKSLSGTGQVIRHRLCDQIDAAVVATVDTENLDVLRAAAYLQEVGVIHSSREKARHSMQMVEQFFGEQYGPLDPRLVDCIMNHVRPQVARTMECQLMQICHKYVTTHYLDYMLWKHHISEKKFEKLQLERIEAYSRYLRGHLRGSAIEAALQDMFLNKGKSRS